MSTNDINVVIKCFESLQQQLTDTKNDLTTQIRDVKANLEKCQLGRAKCIDRITLIEKDEIALKIKADVNEKDKTRKRNLWDVFIKTVTISVVPIILTLLYSIFAIAAKLGINPF